MSKIRIRHGEHEVELDGSDDFIKAQLTDFYWRINESKNRPPNSKIKQEILEPPAKRTGDKEPTPAEFYRMKGKEDGISQILIFGKYLEEYRGLSEFSREDVNKLGKEVKISKDIHGQYFTNAVKQGLLRVHGHGKYSLTLSAESTLSSM
jgi:hypothetical protein